MNANQFNLEINIHSAALKSYALKFTKDLEDADDLVQDTMVKAIRHFEKFQTGTNLKAWLFVILKNTFLNSYHRTAKKHALITQEDEISSANLMKSSASNAAVGSFVMGDIKKALDALPQAYAIPFTRYVEGYKYEEIAQELRIPIGTVKTRIHAARELLKKRLEIYKSRIN